MRRYCLAAVAVVFASVFSEAQATEVFYNVDAFWSLIHEPSVLRELDLSPEQRAEFSKLTDALDLEFFPYRNKSRDEVATGLANTISKAEARLKEILEPPQLQRLGEILLQQLRTQGLLRDDVAASLRLTPDQRSQIREILESVQTAVQELQAEAEKGKPRAVVEKAYVKLKNDELRRVVRVLEPEQQEAWRRLIGRPFDASKLGQPVFKAPELVDTGEWINSPALALRSLRGKVVVLHFYASGCINCIHNFPTYREWAQRFQGRDVVLIGIQTPETQAERDVAAVRARAAEEKLTFPILFDGASENRNAWGNSMWPSVYLIDKRGYVRAFWPGELKWQGADGDRQMAARIEALLSETE